MSSGNAACSVCARTDLSLTGEGLVRAHTANGRRASVSNPRCAGGSLPPKTAVQSPVTASGGPNPYRPPLPTNARLSTRNEEPVTGRKQDEFTSPGTVPRKHSEFDRWDRYLLPHPETGREQAWTRVTTFAKTISGTFALSEWSQRMTLKGATLRPDILAMAHSLDVKEDKDRLNDLVKQAKNAAGDQVAANLGTAVHSFTEIVDSGGPIDDVPPTYRPHVAAYQAKLKEAGLTPHPHYVERVTCIPQYTVAGKFDRLLSEADGSFVVGDVKTGANVQYQWREIEIQLALYAHGVNKYGLWDRSSRIWVPGPKVREDYAIVMHLPLEPVNGKFVCELRQVDIEAGWRAARLCMAVRDRRKDRSLPSIYVPPKRPLSVAAGTRDVGTVTARIPDTGVIGTTYTVWEERFQSVTSQVEAAELWTQAQEHVTPEQLKKLTNSAMVQLQTLGVL